MMTLEEFKSIFEEYGFEINEYLSLDKQTDAIVYIPTVFGKAKFAEFAAEIPIYERDPKTMIMYYTSHVLGQATVYPLKRINTIKGPNLHEGELCEWDTYSDWSEQNYWFKTTKQTKLKNFVDEQMENLKHLSREYKRNQIKWIGED